MRRIGYRSNGFTLIEVMIVVVIIGILAAIAYPSYLRYIERSHISEGRAALLQAAQWMERRYTQDNRYPADTDFPAHFNNDYYTVAAVTTASTYTLTATAKKAGTRCTEMTINQTGVTTPSDCWD
ncbi:type IV pilus assembly protein PilE [Ectothiorhodospira magna]|uniref:Type IV pilus assembly protein PilE n=1 Tax=Ectothiorhodospira magna TaxID=867345 RepID=A0A1H9B7S2_9GAMM|nr:type IV pilin protein [Ectothiorhodospira magna]SEP85004.1 type IV pilus assembly protein PilE [Ectothiorhodospira magna]